MVAQDLASLNLGASASRTLLSNPEAYMSRVSAEEAQLIRSILVPAYRRGFRVIFLVGTSLAVLAFALAFALMPQLELSRQDDAKLKEEGARAAAEEREKKRAKAAAAAAAEGGRNV